ncbi:MAG: NADH-quinone oxidoreductase subunit C [Candidatus Bathyarchaeia archaeon]
MVNPGLHREVIKILLGSFKNVSLSAIVGLDLGDEIELIYSIRADGALLHIETSVPKSNPKIESICDLIPGADFHEREVFDLLGVDFLGHPSLKRLILPEDWPEKLFPLRKDADLTSVKNMPVSPASLNNEIKTNERSIKILLGPQHPAMIEPERFVLTVDGETVVDVKPRIGYVHRGIEKAAEGRTYLQNIYLVERVCGICNACHTTCFCQAVEALLGVSVPKKALYLRTIILELNRIHSHMLLLGHAGLLIGYETLFHYLWRDRESIMELMEILTGNRVITSFITIGGVRRDIKEDVIREMKNKLRSLTERVAFYRAILEDDPTFKARTRNIGFLGREEAVRFCVVGPVARASGVKMDVRKDEPYAAYDEIPFKVIVRSEGDSWARFMVRLDEVDESINIISYALDNLPSGAYRVRVPRIVPAGEAISRVEAPRGELFYYVKSNGSSYPERVKIRTPTFANILSFIHLTRGCNIADIPVIFSSLDPCFSCTDR